MVNSGLEGPNHFAHTPRICLYLLIRSSLYLHVKLNYISFYICDPPREKGRSGKILKIDFHS